MGEGNQVQVKIISDQKERENTQRQEVNPTRTHKGRHTKIKQEVTVKNPNYDSGVERNLKIIMFTPRYKNSS